MTPDVAGPYQLLFRLEPDGRSQTYLALRDGLARRDALVVVKRLSTPLADAHSAQLAQSLNHPSLVSSYGLCREGGAAYWATEYVDGQPLNRVLARLASRGGLPAPLALRILSDLLDAVDYIHSATAGWAGMDDVIHGDIRPHNIYVSCRGEVKLAGFGAPRAAAADRAHARDSVYLAPEQVAADGRVDRHADIFAVGLVMRELLSPRPTQDHAADISLESSACSEVPRLADVKLSSILDRALAHDPAQRFATAAEMRAQIEIASLRLGDPLHAGPTATRVELGRLVHRVFLRERTALMRRLQSLLASEPRAEPTQPAPGAGTLDAVASTHATPAAPSPAPAVMQTQRDEPLRFDSRTSSWRRLPPPTPTAPRPTGSFGAPAASARAELRPTGRAQLRDFARTGIRSHYRSLGAGLCIVFLVVGVSVLAGTKRGEAALPATEAAEHQAETPVLRLCGSTTIGSELAPALIEAYFTRQDSTARIDRHRNPDAKRTRISATSSGRVWVAEIQAQGTATGFEGLAAGRCDIAMASRAIREDEERRMAALGTTMLTSPATEHEIGLDGVAVIVHPNNLLFALQLSQLADVFSGKVRDWSQLGGQPGPIHVLRRDEHSGTYDTFQHLVLGEGGFSPNAQRFDDNSLLADAVASDPAAIGFVGLASVRNAKALALNEPGAPRLLPSPFTVATESYVLSRRLYLYTSYAPRSRWAQDFVRFATSPEGQLVVDRAGFVNNDLLLERPHCGETCSARYKDTIVGAQRVSVELRFDTASRVLERRARRDLDRLVTFLQHHPGARLLLLGFSDASGHANDNLELSRQRAQTVARELQARGIAPRLVAGFGAENAVATNDTLTGRERNRRVEVWIQLEP